MARYVARRVRFFARIDPTKRTCQTNVQIEQMVVVFSSWFLLWQVEHLSYDCALLVVQKMDQPPVISFSDLDHPLQEKIKLLSDDYGKTCGITPKVFARVPGR